MLINRCIDFFFGIGEVFFLSQPRRYKGALGKQKVRQLIPVILLLMEPDQLDPSFGLLLSKSV